MCGWDGKSHYGTEFMKRLGNFIDLDALRDHGTILPAREASGEVHSIQEGFRDPAFPFAGLSTSNKRKRTDHIDSTSHTASCNIEHFPSSRSSKNNRKPSPAQEPSTSPYPSQCFHPSSDSTSKRNVGTRFDCNTPVCENLGVGELDTRLDWDWDFNQSLDWEQVLRDLPSPLDVDPSIMPENLEASEMTT